MDPDRHLALQLAHEACAGRASCYGDARENTAESVLARAEEYLKFLNGERPRSVPGARVTGLSSLLDRSTVPARAL